MQLLKIIDLLFTLIEVIGIASDLFDKINSTDQALEEWDYEEMRDFVTLVQNIDIEMLERVRDSVASRISIDKIKEIDEWLDGL